MIKIYSRMMLFFVSLFIFFSPAHAESVKGIYLTQYTLENTAFLKYLIQNAKAVGINTFVVDFDKPTKRYKDNVALLKDNGIRYVARIVMFEGGGTREQIQNPDIWQKKYTQVQQAVNWGANEIQLDYVRYNTKQRASSDNAQDILKIISWYKEKLAGQNIPLQVDVFGVASFGESKYIGQDIKLFSQSADAICPMVYPSHYEPYAKHFKAPYATVFNSLESISDQFGETMPVKMYPYIELSNYHFHMSRAERVAYIKAQLKAVEDSDAHGWFAWSPHNRYETLFTALGGDPGKTPSHVN